MSILLPLGRIACTLQMSHVAWSVCLCVGPTGKVCKNYWKDPDAVWSADSCESKE